MLAQWKDNAAIICDMIKGNESDVANIDFELQAKSDDIFLCFTCFEIERIDHIS